MTNTVVDNIRVYSINDISIHDLSYIAWLVGKEFGGFNSDFKILEGIQYEKYHEENKNTKWIMAKDLAGEILGFEQIYDLPGIILDGESFNILGTGSLISVQKNLGIGTQIVNELFRFLNSQGKSAIGFCEDSSADFHIKMGREVWKNGGEKFICNGQVSDSHLIVFRGSDGFIEKLERSQNQAVAHYDFW